MSRHSILLLLVAAFALSGCESFESVFGRSEGKRGALPGKREDVFAAESGVKPDTALKESGVDIGAVAEKADWPAPGGSSTRLHGAVALGAAPAEAWSVSVGTGSTTEGPLAAKPIVADGKIFTIDSEANVSAFSVKNGGSLWQQSVPDPRPDSAVAGSGLVYADGRIIATTSYGNVVQLDAGTGKIIWQKMLPAPIRSAPIVAEGKIYVIAMTNTVYELDFADGTLGWNHTGIQENASFLGMASPLAAEDLIVVPYSSGEVFGLRRYNGRMAWEENLSSSQASGALPAMADIQGQLVLDGTRLYAASHSKRLVALDIRTGRMVWEADMGSMHMPWVAGNSLFVITTESQLVALARDDGRVRWSVDLPRYLDPEDKTETMTWTGPVLAGGKVWIAGSQGEIRGLDPQNGKQLSSMAVGAPVYLAPIVAGGTLYVLADDGTLHAYR